MLFSSPHQKPKSIRPNLLAEAGSAQIKHQHIIPSPSARRASTKAETLNEAREKLMANARFSQHYIDEQTKKRQSIMKQTEAKEKTHTASHAPHHQHQSSRVSSKVDQSSGRALTISVIVRLI